MKGRCLVLDKNWHPDFFEYMDFIAAHPNYAGLPIHKKGDGSWAWFATKKSVVGKARIKWCEEKAKELGFPIEPGVYAKVMREIHPTKYKVCQICGREMSIYYHYPSANCIKAIAKRFGREYSEIDHISEIWDDLINQGYTQTEVAEFFISYCNIKISPSSAKDEIISLMEYVCRNEGKGVLSPGAMSNFPDRYDGFHTYNRCCRATQDKGRSKENMKTYTRDRRAYEYWSDGNIHAANQFMGSSFFNGTTADHIGPISLGFVHDPRYLQPMGSGENSSKRNRLQLDDIESILEVESRTGVYPMSWYSKNIWEYIRANYSTNVPKIAGVYRDALKQNMANYMYVLWYILEHCPANGVPFLVKAFLSSNFDCFNYSYEFNSKGEIINQTPRHYTERSRYEIDRYCRVAIEAVYDFNSKSNRNVAPNLSKDNIAHLSNICKCINSGLDINLVKSKITELMENIQVSIINSI